MNECIKYFSNKIVSFFYADNIFDWEEVFSLGPRVCSWPCSKHAFTELYVPHVTAILWMRCKAPNNQSFFFTFNHIEKN